MRPAMGRSGAESGGIAPSGVWSGRVREVGEIGTGLARALG